MRPIMRGLDVVLGLVGAIASVVLYVSIARPTPAPARAAISLDRSPRAYIRGLEAEIAAGPARTGGETTADFPVHGPGTGVAAPTYIDEATEFWRSKRDRPSGGPTSQEPVAVPVGPRRFERY